MITRISFLALTAAFSLASRGASLVENVAAVEECRVAITNAIVAKGGTASGALTNAAAEIAALPSGGGDDYLKLAEVSNGTAVEIISSAITAVRPYQYQNLSSLKCVVLPNATSIGTYAFDGCSAMTNVDLRSATVVNQYAFRYANLQNARFDAMQNINNYSFMVCYGRTSLTFNSLVTLGGGSFSSAEIAEFHSSAAFNQTVNDSVFNYAPYLTVLDIPNVASLRYLFSSGTSRNAAKLDVYMTNKTCTAISSMDYFPWGADTMTKKPYVKFHGSDGYIYHNGSAWVPVTE